MDQSESLCQCLSVSLAGWLARRTLTATGSGIWTTYAVCTRAKYRPGFPGTKTQCHAQHLTRYEGTRLQSMFVLRAIHHLTHLVNPLS